MSDDYDDFYNRYEGRRSRHQMQREGRYGRSPEGYFLEPRGEGPGYGWRGEFGDPYGAAYGHGRGGGYFGTPFDYSYEEENYEGEPYGPGFQGHRPGSYPRRGNWRRPARTPASALRITPARTTASWKMCANA